MKPAYGEWRRKRVSASCILSYYRIRPPPQRFHTLQAHFSHELHFINLTREILSCISLMWCDILALQVRYNIRSFHTRSVYHLHSRYHADTYISRYGGERISLKKKHLSKQVLLLVEHSGLEPLTSTLPVWHSTNWANAPSKSYYNVCWFCCKVDFWGWQLNI